LRRRVSCNTRSNTRFKRSFQAIFSSDLGDTEHQMRIIYIAAAAAVLAVAALAQNDWPAFGHDPGGTRYSTLKQIDARNVTKLVRAWTYHMSVNAAAAPAAPAAGSSEAGDAVEGGRGRGGRGGRGGGGRGGNSEVSPLVVNGVMYLTTGGGRV